MTPENIRSFKNIDGSMRSKPYARFQFSVMNCRTNFPKMLLLYSIFYTSVWTFKVNDPKSLSKVDENCP